MAVVGNRVHAIATATPGVACRVRTRPPVPRRRATLGLCLGVAASLALAPERATAAVGYGWNPVGRLAGSSREVGAGTPLIALGSAAAAHANPALLSEAARTSFSFLLGHQSGWLVSYSVAHLAFSKPLGDWTIGLNWTAGMDRVQGWLIDNRSGSNSGSFGSRITGMDSVARLHAACRISDAIAIGIGPRAVYDAHYYLGPTVEGAVDVGILAFLHEELALAVSADTVRANVPAWRGQAPWTIRAGVLYDRTGRGGVLRRLAWEAAYSYSDSYTWRRSSDVGLRLMGGAELGFRRFRIRVGVTGGISRTFVGFALGSPWVALCLGVGFQTRSPAFDLSVAPWLSVTGGTRPSGERTN